MITHAQLKLNLIITVEKNKRENKRRKQIVKQTNKQQQQQRKKQTNGEQSFNQVRFVKLEHLFVSVLQVGLAVGDIDSIQKTANLRTLIDQALLVDNIQKKYPKTLLRLGYKESMEISPNQNTFIKG